MIGCSLHRGADFGARGPFFSCFGFVGDCFAGLFSVVFFFCFGFFKIISASNSQNKTKRSRAAGRDRLSLSTRPLGGDDRPSSSLGQNKKGTIPQKFAHTIEHVVVIDTPTHTHTHTRHTRCAQYSSSPVFFFFLAFFFARWQRRPRETAAQGRGRGGGGKQKRNAASATVAVAADSQWRPTGRCTGGATLTHTHADTHTHTRAQHNTVARHTDGDETKTRAEAEETRAATANVVVVDRRDAEFDALATDSGMGHGARSWRQRLGAAAAGSAQQNSAVRLASSIGLVVVVD